MTSFRYASTALVAFTLTTHALAQGNAMVTESGASLSAPNNKQDESATPAPDAAAESKPRFIRGNDIVLTPPKAVPPVGGSPLSFNFEEAPVAEVVRTLLGDILKVPYVLHPPLAGTVTLSTRTPIAPDQAVFLLESALQANGLAMVRDTRGTYQVGRPELLRGMGASVRQATRSETLPPGYGAIVIPLQYIGAGEMAAILKPMVPAEAIVRVDPLRNLLIMTGTRTQAEGWLDMVNTFDVDLLKGMSVGVFPLKYVTIQEVETALRLMTGGGAAPAASGGAGGAVAAGTAGAPGGTGRAGAAGAGAAQGGEAGAFFGGMRVVPIERLNSILVVTPRASALEEARRWIEKLDQPGDNGAEPQLFIYKVQNGNAKHLAGVLSGIFGGSTAGAGSTANSGVAPGLASGGV
ncbi:MAG: type II secretion system protein GspD, partial [Comamonadaceae bacterium]